MAYAVTKKKKPTDKPQNFNSLVLVHVDGSPPAVYDHIRLSLPYLIFYFPFLIVHLEENDSVKCVFAGIKLRSIDINDVNVLKRLMDVVTITCVFVYILSLYFLI